MAREEQTKRAIEELNEQVFRLNGIVALLEKRLEHLEAVENTRSADRGNSRPAINHRRGMD